MKSLREICICILAEKKADDILKDIPDDIKDIYLNALILKIMPHYNPVDKSNLRKKLELEYYDPYYDLIDGLNSEIWNNRDHWRIQEDDSKIIQCSVLNLIFEITIESYYFDIHISKKLEKRREIIKVFHILKKDTVKLIEIMNNIIKRGRDYVLEELNNINIRH